MSLQDYSAFKIINISLSVVYLTSSSYLQNAETDLDSQARQMEHHNTKGRQLTQEIRSLPQFDPSVITDDVDKVNRTWKNTGKVSL